MSADPTFRLIGSPKLWDRVVEVFVAREPTVDRLPQEIHQAELRVQPLSGVAQVLGDECRQAQAFHPTRVSE